MTSPTDFFPRDPGRRRAVRLIFLAVALFFAAELVIRKNYGEFYPSLLMPSFAGVGLSTMTATEGETLVAKILVTFSDQSTAEISPARFSGPLFPTVLVAKFFQRGSDAAYRPITPDVTAYLDGRLRALFPGKTPIKASVVLNRVRFPLEHPRQQTVVEETGRREIDFSRAE